MARTPRIAVTGAGAITPAGPSTAALWEVLRQGRSMGRRIPADARAGEDDRAGGSIVACRVEGFDASDWMDSKAARRLDPFARFGLAAALSAHAAAGSPQPEAVRGAVVVGNAVGGRSTSDAESVHFALHGPSRVHPLMPVMTMANAAAALISMTLGWRGPAHTIANTCASGVDAIAYAAELVRSGRVDVALAGGCESTLTPVTLAGFTNLQAMSGRVDDPARASRPFDADRDGFVMGEGSGFVVLERHDDAVARGADVVGVLLGAASGSDAHHLSMPDPDGRGAIECMTAALRDADVTPSEITHVNAHGTSTALNDRTEALAIAAVFGAGRVPVTSNKGAIGHLIGAAGAVETIATLLAANAGEVPPTANHHRLDDGMAIDVVAGSPRPIARGPALTNSFGFGGHNACLVVAPT